MGGARDGDAPASTGSPSPVRGWTFLTHHARVLIEIARNPSIRLRDVANRIGITERSAQGIVTDLEDGGYITRTRVGRRNRYTIDPSRPFRYPTEADQPIEELISLFAAHDQNERRTEAAARDGLKRPQ